jgi:hypothetical protein
LANAQAPQGIIHLVNGVAISPQQSRVHNLIIKQPHPVGSEAGKATDTNKATNSLSY